MPKVRLNAQYINILKEIRDAEELYSNRWMSFNRALKSLEEEKQEYLDVKDLKTVKYVGPTTIEKIRKVLDGDREAPVPGPVSPSKRKRSQSSAGPSKGKRKLQTKPSLEDDFSGGQPQSQIGNEYELAPPAFPFQRSESFSMPNLSQQPQVPTSIPPENPLFEFFFVDSDSRLVIQHDSAEVNIYANTCWYRIRFLTKCLGSPLVGFLRLIPNQPGTTSITSMEAWIKDEHLVQFNLYNATGSSETFPPVTNELNHNTTAEPHRRNSGALGFSESIPRPTPVTIGIAHTSTTQQARGIQGDSLADLLQGEKKQAKVKTLDPTRSLDTAWQVPTSSRTSGTQNDKVTIARLDTGNTTNGSRSVETSSPWLPTPPATQPAVQHSAIAVETTTARAKAKGKRPIRGRTSEFVPAPLPTDEFDLELEKQSASQPTTTSHVPADLIDDITDLTNPQTTFPEFESIVFEPGSFEITLILDNREVKSQTNRDFVYKALKKRQINVEQRSLALGDVLWIAKCHLRSGAVVNHECVLGYILERKRLDDLCQSIKDGRFHEQKFRLANTGLKVFYLVEQYDTEKHEEIFGVQIDTARSSTQVVDGFTLKETRGIEASIDYLATMHKTIVEIYHNKPLHIIPPSSIKRHSYMALQKHLKETKPEIPYLTSYQCFERLNSKSGNMTTRDIFAQMLLCIKGVSAEKAGVIINNFPTMKSLWEAFQAADRIEEENRGTKKAPKASEMLCGLEGEGRKRFGPTLSSNMVAPLAGKPPFATDDPDSLFDNQPKPVPRQRLKPVDETAPGGARESAYNTLDAYFDENDPRASGLGDIGRGLMNADSVYDDSSDEEDDVPPNRAAPAKSSASASSGPADKHRALFEAAVGSLGSNSSPLRNASPTSPVFPIHGINVIKPGQTTNPFMPGQTTNPFMPSPQSQDSAPSPHQSVLSLGGPPPPAALRAGINSVAAPAPRQPQPAFMQQPLISLTPSPSPMYAISLPGTPGPRMPQTLPPSQTPIVPVFARPKDDGSIKFGEKVGILRGDSEETFLPRGRGGKADDFWRRFSMVAKEDAKTGSQSAWLRKTQNGTTRLAAWVWIVGIGLLLLIGGAIGVGWFFTHNKPAGQPLAIGGSAGQTSGSSASPVSVNQISPTVLSLSAPPLPSSTFNPNKRFLTEFTMPSDLPHMQRRSLVNRMHY